MAGTKQEPFVIPGHVRLRGKLLLWFYPRGWRSFLVRYWESQGISEETQMQGPPRPTNQTVLSDLSRHRLRREPEQFGADGNLEYVLDNGNGTSGVVIRDPSNPTGEPITKMDGVPNSGVAERLQDGRWNEL